jgi:DNA-binding GntR family transcriptional regulator
VTAFTPSKYLDVAAELQRRIATGAYPASTELPSAGALASELGVSPQTVGRALRELDELGLTGGRQGRPRWVLGRSASARSRSERAAGQLRQTIDTVMSPGARLPSEPALASTLGVSRATVRIALKTLEVGGEVTVRSGRRYVAGRSRTPDLAYERVAADLRRDIARRRWRPGESLPGEVQLAAAHGVSRPTVRQALALLRSEGRVRSVPRLGWFVTDRPAGKGTK